MRFRNRRPLRHRQTLPLQWHCLEIWTDMFLCWLRKNAIHQLSLIKVQIISWVTEEEGGCNLGTCENLSSIIKFWAETAQLLKCDYYIYRPQRSWGKVIFSQASMILSTGGGSSRGGGGACSWGGVCSWGGLQAHTQGGIWGGSGPGPHPRGKLRGIWSRPPPRQLLLWAVRILLECILVICFVLKATVSLEPRSNGLQFFSLSSSWTILKSRPINILHELELANVRSTVGSILTFWTSPHLARTLITRISMLFEHLYSISQMNYLTKFLLKPWFVLL